MKVIFTILFFSLLAEAGTLEQVQVAGKEKAELTFLMKDGEAAAPQIKVQSNIVDLTFAPGVVLSEGVSQEYNRPHPLIQKISFSTEEKALRARIVVLGNAEDLKNRLNLEKEDRSVRLFVSYPMGAAWKEAEQLPLASFEKETQKEAPGRKTGVMLVLFLLVVAGAIGTIVFLKFARHQGIKKGSRKYLIEQLAYHPLGDKKGVALIKVGSEFVLIGVTPQQISTLSHLPGLEKRYEEEAVYERDHFRVAVEEELGRMNPSKNARVNA